MTKKTHQDTNQENYAQVVRYLDNAKEDLQRAGKNDDGKNYKDKKYIRRASGTAYSAVLMAVDIWLGKKGIFPTKKDRKSIDFYRNHLRTLDMKMLNYLNLAYDTLHLSGYYDGNLSRGNIADGFEAADFIVKRIHPYPEAL
ncbi:MAG: DUF5618 family protein [Fibromonadaceae bacterium]|jgi:hypothetical protein|nr:DUF5618 family protein [Fibromonadaceae bacterium]